MVGNTKKPRDRRAQHRAAADIPATVQLGSEEFGCSIRDLSTEGIALSHNGGARPGSILRVVFRLPNSPQPLEIAGVLVRTEPQAAQGTWGLRFVDPPPQAVKAIGTYVSRNRSDLPFSHRGEGPGGPSTDRLGARSETATRLDNTLKSLYEEAVVNTTDKKPKRGWFRRRPRT